MKANIAMTPPGGWHYDQPMTGGGKPIGLKAVNFDKLKEAVFEFRLANNIPIGDIERDIHDFLCVNGEGGINCQPEPADFGLPVDVPRDKRMSDRVAEWVAQMRRMRPVSLVSLKQAAERQAICSKCFRNKSWSSRCGSCDDRVKSESALIRDLRPTSKYPLLACECGGWDLETATNLDESALNVTDAVRSVLPASCWVKKV